MELLKKKNLKETAEFLKNGGVGVLPTDTLYGLVGQALNKKAVARIYKLRKRQASKPLIILISSLTDLKNFSVQPSALENRTLKKIWPGKVSVILPCRDPKFKYLHRGSKSLAFRMPNNKYLAKLIKITGPLVAPSANFEGLPPAETTAQAQKYFGSKVDFYVDAGRKHSLPSTLIKLINGSATVLRQGSVRVKHL